jgi:hypothetical protein
MQGDMDVTTGRLERRIDVPLLCVGVFALFSVVAYLPEWIPFLRALLGYGFPSHVTDRDFANYWLAARLFLEGDHHILFMHDQYFAYFKEVLGPDSELRAWSYPPSFLLLLWPLGWFEYKTALVLFLAVTFALFLFAAHVARRELAPEARPEMVWLAIAAYFSLMVIGTQNGFLLGALLLLGLAWMKHRPMLAGLVFGLLTVKPQLGLLIPLLLVFDRNWKAIGWSTLFAVLLFALSVAFCGIDSWRGFLHETVAYQGSVMTDWKGIFLKMMPTAFGSIRALGYSHIAASFVQLNVSIAALALIVWLLFKEPDPLRRCFVVTCGTFLVTPYAFNYDMGALSVIAALLAASNRAPAARAEVIAIAAVAGISAAVTNVGRAGWPITPLVLAAGLLVIAAGVLRSQSQSVPALGTQSSAQ